MTLCVLPASRSCAPVAEYPVLSARVVAPFLHQCSERLSANAGCPAVFRSQPDQHWLAPVPAMGLCECTARDDRRVCHTSISHPGALALLDDSDCGNPHDARVFLEHRDSAGSI